MVWVKPIYVHITHARGKPSHHDGVVLRCIGPFGGETGTVGNTSEPSRVEIVT